MDNKRIISSTAGIFTLSLGFVSAFNLMLGGSAEELRSVSQLFALCGEGISFTALAELLALSFLISLARFLWFSERLFKNMLMVNRVTFMLISVFLAAGACSVLFGWFPAGMWQAWVGFTFSFVLGTAVSFATMAISTKAESKKYQQNLNSYNHSEENRGEDND
ncbi:MAG: hypothetical protein IJM51_08590 [Clostridia bacterium]|nr:hypothetical protein [Clostridia bacterium]